LARILETKPCPATREAEARKVERIATFDRTMLCLFVKTLFEVFGSQLVFRTGLLGYSRPFYMPSQTPRSSADLHLVFSSPE
jgi:hypothetical protein